MNLAIAGSSSGSGRGAGEERTCGHGQLVNTTHSDCDLWLSDLVAKTLIRIDATDCGGLLCGLVFRFCPNCSDLFVPRSKWYPIRLKPHTCYMQNLKWKVCSKHNCCACFFAGFFAYTATLRFAKRILKSQYLYDSIKNWMGPYQPTPK